ncbi:hypothetical protein PV326_011054, partial [Microctonus aethiopoides]
TSICLKQIAHVADVMNPVIKNCNLEESLFITIKKNAVNILTSQVELTAMQSTSSAAVAECRPNSHIDDIIAFSHGSFLRYTCDGGKLLPQRDDLKPLILTGDFNVNFALDTSIKLTDFLQQQLN